MLGFGQPPDGVDRVLGADLALVDPLDRRGELGGVMPEELLGQEEAALVAQPQ